VPAAVANDDGLIGYTLDRYRILRVIGKGGMGVVYEAEHTQLGKRVAVKLMLEKYANDHEAIARFQREALAASRIGNPHIIDVSDIGTAPDGRAFVVMELLSGVPLTDVIKQAGAMPAWRAIHIIRQVLRAVGAAHAKGIVHRDLKPDNIFLVSQGEHHDFVKLLDFGISKMVDTAEAVAATRLTSTGMVMGTPLYMAPEQALGNEVDQRVDLYASGVILYELLTGHPPFEGATYAVLVAKLLTQIPTPINQLRPDLSPQLVAAVHRALEKEPTQRFGSANEFVAALPGDRTSSQLDVATIDSVGAVVPRPTRPRRAKWPWVAGLLAVSVSVGAGVVVALSRKADPDKAAAKLAADPPPAKQAPTVEAVEAPKSVPKAGTLEVKSNPEKAAVTVDGTSRGMTPVIVTLDPGTHHLHVEASGHTSIDEDEEVRSAERTSVVIVLPTSVATPTKAAPKQVTRPKGASVVKTADPKPVSPYAQEAPPPVETPKVDKPTVPKSNPPGDKATGTKPNPY
jgi:serine/threonine-protein kinase